MIDKFEVEGYILFNIESKEYLDETGYTCCYLNNAVWFKKLSDVEKEQELLDEPNKWTIKKIHIQYTAIDMNQDYYKEKEIISKLDKELKISEQYECFANSNKLK
jgi:hypothetical protein